MPQPSKPSLIKTIKAKRIEKYLTKMKQSRNMWVCLCVFYGPGTGTEHTPAGLHGKYTAPHTLNTLAVAKLW